MTGLAIEFRDVTKEFPDEERENKKVTAVYDLDLEVNNGEFFTLLGPSGCGKTTTLRLIAGFEQPTSGDIFIQGKPVSGVPPYKRPVNTVFQNYALFPHLNVFQNVEFGLVVKKVEKELRRQMVLEALELVRLRGYEKRKPAQLSGGQQQRVALARALVNRPAVLLLDEPLGALDLKLRKEMQFELKQLQKRVGITFVYVTHDQEEALTMSDRIAILEQGYLIQVDTPQMIYERPATRFVASFVGDTNFLNARVKAVQNGHLQIQVAGREFYIQRNGEEYEVNQDVLLTMRPEKLALTHYNSRPDDERSTIELSGVVQDAVFAGTDTRYVVELPTKEKLVALVRNVGMHGIGEFTPGEQVKVWCNPVDSRMLES